MHAEFSFLMLARVHKPHTLLTNHREKERERERKSISLLLTMAALQIKDLNVFVTV
jgi:hypothetical protein